MTRHPLDTLIELAREARDKAATMLADERNGQQQLKAQIELLQGYRGEYSQRLQENIRHGMDMATLRDYQVFLASLDKAIDQARETIAEQQQRVAQRQLQWQQQQRRLSSFDTLLTRRNNLLQRQLVRREQQHHDEINTNAFARQFLARAAQEHEELP